MSTGCIVALVLGIIVAILAVIFIAFVIFCVFFTEAIRLRSACRFAMLPPARADARRVFMRDREFYPPWNFRANDASLFAALLSGGTQCLEVCHHITDFLIA